MDIYPGKEDKLVYEADTAIQHLKVFDKMNGFRYLTLNGVQHGGNLPGRPERLVLPYFRSAMAALVFLDKPKDYLFIGLGMGAMPAFLKLVQPDAEIDVVEIDPDVVGVAEVWFGLTQGNGLKVTVGDGRKFVVETEKRYDAVFLDAYQDLGVPTHLTTVEFMREVRGILKPGGVAVSNLWGSVVNPIFDNCVSTLLEVFPQLYQFKSYTYNYIFIADTSDRVLMPGELLTRAKKATAKMPLGFDLVELVRKNYTRLDKDSAGAMLLRD
ncbi:MAG: fused MFS/spermidine synthase [Nitrospirae bacterium]|nr:fused MFS/spermidine synthase [Nitrospirota bacterium]